MYTYRINFIYRTKMTLEEAKNAGFGKVSEYTFYDTRDCTEFKTDLFPTKEEIESKILFEWKRKKITNRTIIEICHPEKIH